ncbi:MAG: hypothetical protein K2G35_07885 [Duncaniella sp.]|nr:hypothetical protein [Duncaniella sp.]
MATILTKKKFTNHAVIEADSEGRYIIDSIIEIDTQSVPTSKFISITFPENSIIEFRGEGRIVCNTNVVLNLQGSQIIALSTWILGKNVYFRGCGNTQVQSEWFNDPDLKSKTSSDHFHINKALACAAASTDEPVGDSVNYDGSAPEVVLQHRLYHLTASIELCNAYFFPNNSFSFSSPTSTQTQCSVELHTFSLQRFTSPGCISSADSNTNFALIKIKCQSVNLNVDRLKGGERPAGSTTMGYTLQYLGTGIEFSGYTENSNITVRHLQHLYRGISVIYNPPASVDPKKYLAAVQYTRFSFQIIDADYGFYFDLYDPDDSSIKSYFNENLILGGRLMGGFGIYIEDHSMNASDMEWKLDGNVFANIGFEGLRAIPLYLRGIHASEFTALRMMEALPGIFDKEPYNADAVWVDLKKVATVNMSIKGSLLPNHFKAENCTHVIVNGWVSDMDDATRFHFDRMAFLPLNYDGQYTSSNLKVMTSSIQPYNMEREVRYTDGYYLTTDPYSHIELGALMPLNNTLYLNKAGERHKSTCLVLPRQVRLKAETGKPALFVNLSGLHLLTNWLSEMTMDIDEGSFIILRYCFYNPDVNSSTTGGSDSIRGILVGEELKSVSFINRFEVKISESGRYGLSFNNHWDLILTKLG